MKKYRHQIFRIAVILLVGGVVNWLILSFASQPPGSILFSVLIEQWYTKVGVTELYSPKQKTTLSIYKSKDKPFLLVGPFQFSDDDYNFFFVNKKQVICTANDKGGELWMRLGFRLWVADDLTGEDRLRVDFGNILQQPVQYDKKADVYHFIFSISGKKEICTFDIPAKFFTPDMENVPNIAASLIK